MNNAGQVATDAFLNLGSWREADIQNYIQKVVPGVDNAKRTMANYTSGYYGRIAAAERQAFRAVSVPATELATEALRNGSTAQMIWERPFKEMWTELSKGKDFSDALRAGARRADWTARTEVQLAKRQAGLSVRDGNSNIVGYLRTLSGAENCGLCYVASTQRYNRGDLMPIHPGCDCGETPIYGNTDVGQVIDEQTLGATHEAVSERFGRFDAGGREIDYRKITIVDHGELGPYLTVKGQEFTKVKPQDLTTKIKAPKPVPASKRKTFSEALQPKLTRINGAKIADDITAEHGNVNVKNLKGKAKIQTLGEKTEKHLKDVKDLGREVDFEINKRVKAAVNELADPKEIAFAQKQIKSAEELLARTKLQYEAGLQQQIAVERARIELRAQARLKELAADGFDQNYLDNYRNRFYSPEAILREATLDADSRFRFTEPGRRLLNEISEYQKDLVQYRQVLPANVVPGTERFNQLYAAKAKEVLEEVRDLGKGGPSFVGNAQANEIISQAKAVYPTKWLEKAKEVFPEIRTANVKRGYWNEFTRQIGISFNRGKGFEKGYATAVHEIGHMFENSVPGIKQLEFAYAHQRAALNPKRTNLGSREVGFEDAWRNLYTGKDYGYNTDSSYEIFTTGIESVFSGSDMFEKEIRQSQYANLSLGPDAGTDDDFRQFILGVLFTV